MHTWCIGIYEYVFLLSVFILMRILTISWLNAPVLMCIDIYEYIANKFAHNVNVCLV